MINRREPNESEPNKIDIYAERICEDVIKAFDAWIRPELAKVIGWTAVNGIQNQDFESVLQSQYKMLFLQRSHTVRKHGATFYFKLCQGLPEKGKHTVLNKFSYTCDFEDYE